MKVAYLTHSLNIRTGVGVFSSTLIEGLRRKGIVPITLMSENLLPPSKWSILKNFPRIRREMRSVDVVHALDGFPYGVIAAFAAGSKPLVITAIGTGALQKLSHPLHGPLLRWSYRRARIVTAPSRYIARELEKRVLGLTVRVINHGVDFDYWSQPESLPQERFIISVGAIKLRKGYHLLIPVVARILREDPKLRWIIVARPEQSPAYFAELKLLLEEEGIEERVEFRSAKDRGELRTLYAGALLHVLAPYSVEGDVEGFGLVFLEAAAAGCPSVATSGTGADDAISDGKSGYLVSPRDPEALYATMKRVIDDRGLRVSAREFARSMDWAVKIDEYFSLYETL